MSKNKTNVTIYFVIAGLGLVLLDVVIDWIVFFEGSLWDAIYKDVDAMELYMRLTIMVVFLVFGIVLSRHLKNKKKIEIKMIQHASQLETLARSVRKFNEQLEITLILRRLVESALELTGASDGAAALLEDGKLVFTEYNANGKLVPINYVFEEGQGVPGHVMKTKEPYFTNDAENDSHVIPEIQQKYGFLTLVDVPIINQHGELIGCFEIHNKKDKSYFNNLDIELLLGLASSAAIAIENTRILEKQRKAEEKYRQVVEVNPDVIYQLDANGIIEFISPRVYDLLGRKCCDLVGRPFADIVHPDDLKKMDRVAEKRTGGRAVRGLELRLIGKNTIKHVEARWVGVSATGIYDDGYIGDGQPDSRGEPKGEYIGTIGNLTDITAKLESERNLQESEDRFRLLMHQSPSVIEIYDLDGLQIEVNKAYEKLWGFPASHTVNKFNVLTSKEIQDTGLLAYVKRAYAGETVQVPEYSYDATGETEAEGLGREKWLSTRIYPIKNTQGKVTNIVIGHEDISERKRAEEQRVELERKVSRLKNMELLGLLAGGVAHDLNNIFSGIVSYPDLLLLQISEDSPLRSSIETIKNSGERAAAIVQDLLTFARRGVPVNEVINLNKVIEEYLISPEYEYLISNHSDVAINVSLGENLMNMLGSPIHLSKSIMNLASNAFEATPENGAVEITTSNRYLDRPVNGYDHVEEGEYIVLTVSDNGSGISEEDIGKIFDPFYTKKKMGMSGTGLGMAIVYGTVVDHHGYINVESVINEGTTFTLYFPITRQEQEDNSNNLSFKELLGNGETILVVDDDEQQRNLTEAMLSALNYSVSSVSSGERAIQYLKTNSADVLLLDMIMDPGIDGLDTFKGILEWNPDQKAVIASGYSETVRVKEAQKLGAGAYLRKPFIKETLGRAMQKSLAT